MFTLILTKFMLVLLVSSSGMGMNTANAMQFEKMVNKMMISKVLGEETQDRNNIKKGGPANSQLPTKGNLTKGYNIYNISLSVHFFVTNQIMKNIKIKLNKLRLY